MSLNVTWLFERPDGVDESVFENWYLDQHVRLAKRLPGLRRYTVNRLVDEQSAEPGMPPVFRVAQLIWDDAVAASTAFNSPDGLATVGDGAVHAGLGYTWALALTDDRALPVERPAAFDIISGGFRGSPDGTITKVLAYGAAEQDLAAVHAEECAGLGVDPRLRGHLVGAGRGDRVDVGLISFPAAGDTVCTWSVEWWFDDPGSAAAFLAGPGRPAVQRLRDGSAPFFLGVFTSRELYRSVDALPAARPLPC